MVGEVATPAVPWHNHLELAWGCCNCNQCNEHPCQMSELRTGQWIEANADACPCAGISGVLHRAYLVSMTALRLCCATSFVRCMQQHASLAASTCVAFCPATCVACMWLPVLCGLLCNMAERVPRTCCPSVFSKHVPMRRGCWGGECSCTWRAEKLVVRSQTNSPSSQAHTHAPQVC